MYIIYMVYPFFDEKVLHVEIPAFVNARRSLPIQCMPCPKYYSTEKHAMYIGFKNMFYEVKIGEPFEIFKRI